MLQGTYVLLMQSAGGPRFPATGAVIRGVEAGFISCESGSDVAMVFNSRGEHRESMSLNQVTMWKLNDRFLLLTD